MHTPFSRRAPWRRSIALLAALGLALTACGGGDDDDNAGGGDNNGGGQSTTETTAAGEPVRGGTLVYAVEADTASPWLPASMVCAAACHSTVGRTVFEPLVELGDDGKTYPYLLQSIEPNEDFTVWTLVVRQGIKFHDGTDLNADAVAFNLERSRNSALLAQAVKPISEITTDANLTVTVTMSSPWPAFPTYLNSQLGYMGSPQWISAVEAGDEGLATQPVGTGPFKFESYEPGDNGSFRATRFEDYWRGDGPNSLTGEGLPYLDAVEIRFIPDSQARSQALLAGDLDLVQTNNGVEIGELEENDDVEITVLDSPFETETSYLLINNSPQVNGEDNPFADVRVRRALAMATNNEVLQEARTGGLFPPANGPFPPGVIGHLDDSGYPAYDPEGATALLEEVEADTGAPVTIHYKTTNDPFGLDTAELLQSMWEEVGFDVTIDQAPQGDFINQALAGNFQVFGWRNHSGVDPDQQFVWWSSTTTTGIALNFGRIIDDEVDSLLNTIRTATDADERQAAAEDLNRRFADQVFNVWNNWVYWGFAHGKNVFNTRGGTLIGPDNQPLTDVRMINIGANLAGMVNPTEIFKAS